MILFLSFDFFAPFNFLYSTSSSCPSGTSFFEEKQKLQCQTKQKLTKILPPKSLSGHSAGLLFSQILFAMLFV